MNELQRVWKEETKAYFKIDPVYSISVVSCCNSQIGIKLFNKIQSCATFPY
jgi:hypothetical protein